MSSEYMFGLGRVFVSDVIAERLDQIAQQYGARFTAVTLPGDGPRYWFSSRNQGDPANRDLEREVLEAVAAAGIVLPGRRPVMPSCLRCMGAGSLCSGHTCHRCGGSGSEPSEEVAS